MYFLLEKIESWKWEGLSSYLALLLGARERQSRWAVLGSFKVRIPDFNPGASPGQGKDHPEAP